MERRRPVRASLALSIPLRPPSNHCAVLRHRLYASLLLLLFDSPLLPCCLWFLFFEFRMRQCGDSVLSCQSLPLFFYHFSVSDVAWWQAQEASASVVTELRNTVRTLQKRVRVAEEEKSKLQISTALLEQEFVKTVEDLRTAQQNAARYAAAASQVRIVSCFNTVLYRLDIHVSLVCSS